MSDNDPESVEEPNTGSDVDARLGGGDVGASDAAPVSEHTQAVAADVGAKDRSKVGWIIGGSLAGGVVLVAAIVAVAITMSSGSAVQAVSAPSSSALDADLVVVPDLVGMTVAEARSELEEIGLTLVVPEDADEDATVATQTLSEGREVTVGTEVSATVAQTAEPARDSLGFADGAALDPLAMVGWQFSLGGDDASWTSSPDAGEGEVVFVNSDGTCTAQYWQQTFDTTAEDDLAATDEFLADMSGATEEEMAEYAFDGRFALSGGLDEPTSQGDVATRTLLWSDDQSSYLLTARVFRNLDYATSTMSNAYLLQIQCDADVNPQDVIDSLDEVAKVSVNR
ncbi:PASTA domain-containing protein [Microbacterium sp. NPDC056569]|uniref:PASTA domain-containing protein n=1 Tax=Microbacterium sp. NPDC056569 TaxID=3345867 RepID=UPI00366AB6DB